MPELNDRAVSNDFIEMLVLIHRQFYRGMTTPVPLNQFAVLMVLRVEEPASPKFIGDILHISKQQMTSITEKLYQNGFIIRATDPNDRRRLLISLTPAGMQVLENQNDFVRQRFLKSLKGLAEEEQAELARSIMTLSHYIEKMQGRAEKNIMD